MNKNKRAGFAPMTWVMLGAALLGTAFLCICLGSVTLPFSGTWVVLRNALLHREIPQGLSRAIILSVRLPRVVCVALTGACLALAGCAMQGLLKNPLADGSTLGVSSGASLGACLSIAFSVTLPHLPMLGTMGMAIVFAFLSMVIVLTLSIRLDGTLSTNTLILVGVIFSMFVSAFLSLVVTFSGEKVKSLTFFTMGSLAGADSMDLALLLIALVIFGPPLFFLSNELNAFSLGEENARHVGVAVRRVKLTVLICVSALIGACVAVGGTIGFVGLVTPHMARGLVGPNHKRLLPASAFFGAIFLMLSDLLARVLLRPLELPIGVVTSLIGAVVFIVIFARSRRRA